MPLVVHSHSVTQGNRPHERYLWRWLFALILFPASACIAMDAALAAPAQSLRSIEETAQAFIEHQIEREFPNHEIDVNDLDSRLKLTTCDAPLEGFLPPGGHLPGNTTVGIRCPGSKPWTVYVSATVKATREVVITKRPILSGSSITKSDIALEKREVTGNTDAYIYDPAHVLGKIAKRPLTSATALTPGMLDAPLMVHRGQQITILAEEPGIEIRMTGTALMDGAEGQVVRAQNGLSKRTVEGLAIQPGIIRVNM